MKQILLAFLLFIASSSAFPQYSQVIRPGKVKTLNLIDNGVTVMAENARMIIQVYSPGIIRIRVTQKEARDDFSYAVIQKPSGGFREITDSEDYWLLRTDSLEVRVTKGQLGVGFYSKNGNLLCQDYQSLPYTWQGTEVTCYKALQPAEKFIGLGEKTGNLNRRGEKFVNWNSDIPGYSLIQDPLYVSIPFYMGIHGKVTYGIFLDNSFRTKFNFGASTDDQFASFSAADGEMNYYFFGASSIAGIIRDYTWLTGRIQLPPYWSLGYQQCRWSYYPESEVLSMAQKFRDKKIPCDVIYLDIDYMDAFKIFTWNREYFPQPKAMIDKLKGMGFHVVTIVDPGIKIEKGYTAYEQGVNNNYFIRYPAGPYYVGNVWPGRCHFPDFTKEAARKWWGSSFSALIDPGVEGFWNDMNEPSAWGQSIPDIVEFDFDGHKSSMAEAHNVYGLNMARATFEGTKSLLSGKRPFVLTRAGYAGIQRYSAVWTGDNVASDEHMLLSARMVSSMGLSGLSFAGPDMGGFIGNPSKELYERWLSLGVYTPFLRNHSAINTKDKEPWSFGEDAERLSIELLSQRYRLLPYIYSAFYQSAQTGMPVARSLAINYTFDDKVYSEHYQNEYLFGDNLLVIPVSCDQHYARVYFPAGGWYRLSTDAYYEGNTEAIVEAPLYDLPVFAKASGIILKQPAIEYTRQNISSATLDIHVYKGSEVNALTWYEDDGMTYNYEKGEYCRRIIKFDPADEQNDFIDISGAEGSFASKFSHLRVILHNFGAVTALSVYIDDKKTDDVVSEDRYSVKFNNSTNHILVQVKY